MFYVCVRLQVNTITIISGEDDRHRNNDLCDRKVTWHTWCQHSRHMSCCVGRACVVLGTRVTILSLQIFCLCIYKITFNYKNSLHYLSNYAVHKINFIAWVHILNTVKKHEEPHRKKYVFCFTSLPSTIRAWCCDDVTPFVCFIVCLLFPWEDLNVWSPCI